MSSEESSSKQTLMPGCMSCDILAGERSVPGGTIYEDDCWAVMSIIRPVLTADVLGRTDFGVISGLTAMIYIAGFALGPSVGSALWLTGGYNLMLMAAVGMAAVGAILLLIARTTTASGG